MSKEMNPIDSGMHLFGKKVDIYPFVNTNEWILKYNTSYIEAV